MYYRRVPLLREIILLSGPILAGGLAHAATLSYLVTTPTYPNPVAAASATFTFPRFDETGGLILSSAAFRLTGVGWLTVSGDNITATDGLVMYKNDHALVMMTLNRCLTWGFPLSLGNFQGSLTVSPGPFAYQSPTQTASASTTVCDLYLNQYLGTGSVTHTVWSSDGGPYGDNPGYLFSSVPINDRSISSSWAAQLEVEYTYSTPEPGTFGSVTICIGVLLSLARRRQTSRV
jgi:hypothetical protein